MKIHELNCGTLCPFSRRLVNGSGSWFGNGGLICRCLLLETEAGLVLVDSGLGLRDVLRPLERLGRASMLALRPRLDRKETAIEQIQALGFQPGDVRHIIVTHMDLDHCGGIMDFPSARVHIYEDEFQAAVLGKARDKARYRPIQWNHGPLWERYRLEGGLWEGFAAVKELKGLPPEILLVPLAGHTLGHAAVAVQVADRWILHAGDAIFDRRELDEPADCPLGLRIFLDAFANDRKLRAENVRRLMELKKAGAGRVEITCSHDPEMRTGLLVQSRP